MAQAGDVDICPLLYLGNGRLVDLQSLGQILLGEFTRPAEFVQPHLAEQLAFLLVDPPSLLWREGFREFAKGSVTSHQISPSRHASWAHNSLDYHPAMVLEDLHELVETLQRRIAEHGPALQQSEALTRYALIDPLLRGLGWDTGDPSQVLVEYRSDAGQADYALLGNSIRPQVIVEAKRLGTQFESKVRQQVTSYCQEEGVPFAAITDGRRWELYDIFLRAAMKDSIVTAFDLSDPPGKTCVQALALWRPSAVSGSLSAGTASVLGHASTDQEGPSLPNFTPSRFQDEDWQPLSHFEPMTGSVPDAVRLPDSSSVSTRGWGDFIAEVGRWLYENDLLSESLLPIQRSQNSFVLAKEPVNPTGKNFSASRRVGPFYANVNFTAVTLVRNARAMIQATDQDPANFAVRLQKAAAGPHPNPLPEGEGTGSGGD